MGNGQSRLQFVDRCDERMGVVYAISLYCSALGDGGGGLGGSFGGGGGGGLGGSFGGRNHPVASIGKCHSQEEVAEVDAAVEAVTVSVVVVYRVIMEGAFYATMLFFRIPSLQRN